MIENATITGLTPPPTVSMAGDQTFASVTATNVRILLDSPSRAQKLATDVRINTADAFAYVPLSANVPVQLNSRLIVELDGAAAVTYTVQMINSRVKGAALSHQELALKVVA